MNVTFDGVELIAHHLLSNKRSHCEDEELSHVLSGNNKSIIKRCVLAGDGTARFEFLVQQQKANKIIKATNNNNNGTVDLLRRNESGDNAQFGTF